MNVEKKKELDEWSVQKQSKVGTWISVGVVLLVILFTYFLLYGIYMGRI